jgi:RNA polymerase sigma factor (sigma-70 family)
MKLRIAAQPLPGLEALTEAYCRVYDRLVASVQAKVRSRETAEDIVQDVWLKLLAAPAGVVEPEAYVVRVTGNLALDVLRRQGRQARWLAPIEPPTTVGVAARAEAGIIAREQARRFNAAVAALPPRRRQIFLLRHVQGLGHADIAGRLDISVAAVEKHLFRCLLDLRATMREAP